MDMENFNIYLGTYYSILDSDGDKKHGDDTDDRYGARVRFKYFFWWRRGAGYFPAPQLIKAGKTLLAARYWLGCYPG